MKALKHVLLLLLFVFLLTSCTDPNIYTSLGLYDPLKESKGSVETIEVHKERDFNLLNISSSYSGIINLEYRPKENYLILKQLREDEITALVQSLYYVSRYDNIEEYLSTPLDEETKRICESTKLFSYDIIDEVAGCVLNIAYEVEKYYPDLNVDEIDKFFKEFKKTLDPEKGCTTIKDYIAIQLTVDMLASSIDMLYQILITIPSDVTDYIWNEIIVKEEFWSDEDTINIIRDNALSLIAILLDAVSEIDLVGSDIPSFVNLSTIIGEFL